MAKAHETHKTETKKHGKAEVRPSSTTPGKFEAVAADGTVNPYQFRSEADAWASLGVEAKPAAEEKAE